MILFVCEWDRAESVNTSFNANPSLPEQPHPSLFFSLLPSHSLKVELQHIDFSQLVLATGKIYTPHTQLRLKPSSGGGGG